MGTAMIGVGGIVAGGVLLGSMLGALADPVPKNLPDDGALSAGSLDPAASYDSVPSYQFVEAGPAELEVPAAADHYAPAWAPAWASDGAAWTYPEPDYSPWTPEPYPTLAELDARIEAERAAAELALPPPEVVPAEISPKLPAEPPLRESELAALY
jgi:hypothetical protein